MPKVGEGFIDFIGQVHKTKEGFGQEGPIVVHCSAGRCDGEMPFLTLVLPLIGVGRTGVFITLSIVFERIRYEGIVDVFQTVKLLRTQRPALVQTEVRNCSENAVFELTRLLRLGSISILLSVGIGIFEFI